LALSCPWELSNVLNVETVNVSDYNLPSLLSYPNITSSCGDPWLELGNTDEPHDPPQISMREVNPARL
jgi:hypothetical protein